MRETEGRESSERREQWHQVLWTDRQGPAKVYLLHSLAAGHHRDQSVSRDDLIDVFSSM